MPTLQVGAFELERAELGSGGYGQVFRAKEQASGEVVACKVINTKKMRREAVVREVKLMSMLAHDHVIGLRGTEEMKNQVFVFMELAPKGDLFARVISCGSLPEKDARKYYTDMMRGVEYLHLCGVVHRDLKLENVLICEDDVCKLCDFGLAHVFQRDEEDQILQVPLHEVCGSKSYAAPEVLNNQGAGYDGFAADVWSCGICLFAMVAGFFPLDEAVASDWRFNSMVSAHDQGMSLAPVIYGFYNRDCNLSVEAVALVDLCLVLDPPSRCCSTDILEHAWSLGEALPPDQIKGVGGADADYGCFGMKTPVYRAMSHDSAPPLDKRDIPTLGRQVAFGEGAGSGVDFDDIFGDS